MSTPIKITVDLDRARSLTWGPRARVRLDSLPRAPRRGGIYMMCALLWAMLDDDQDFAAPEDLGEWLQTGDQVKAAGKAILAAQKQAEDSPKNAHGSTPKPPPASS